MANTKNLIPLPVGRTVTLKPMLPYTSWPVCAHFQVISPDDQIDSQPQVTLLLDLSTLISIGYLISRSVDAHL